MSRVRFRFKVRGSVKVRFGARFSIKARVTIRVRIILRTNPVNKFKFIFTVCVRVMVTIITIIVLELG
jgi:hypothetical protein